MGRTAAGGIDDFFILAHPQARRMQRPHLKGRAVGTCSWRGSPLGWISHQLALQLRDLVGASLNVLFAR